MYNDSMSNFDDEKQDKRVDELKHQEEEDLVQILAEQKYGIPSINLSAVPIENEALRYVTEEKAREMKVAPFKLLGKNIHIAVRTPEDPRIEELAKELATHALIPHFYMASMASLEKVWGRYKELSQATTTRVGGMDISGETILDLAKRVRTINETKKEIERVIQEEKIHKVSILLEVILASAISIDASDVHMEPEEDFVRLRYRLDGVLIDMYHFTADIHKLMNSRLKLMAGMKLSTNALAQDGRFSIFLGEDEISMRVSVVPSEYGEGIVMRILNPKSIQVKLEEMGIQESLYEIMMRDIKKPNGLVLLTGPTGSGKTTTLYAFLRKIYSPELKMMTIEDPVEYHLEGITQTQVDHEKGYDFLGGLRAALRQDPDVIMVGEIRDAETAKIAVEAALTGHLVFSTLHTNNAAGVIPRLIDLDVNPKILVSALSLSVAQRLIRKLCDSCKEKIETVDKKQEELVRGILKQAEVQKKPFEKYGLTADSPITMWKATGCEKCNMTGYKGRIGVFEAIQTDEAIEKIIPENPSEREIKRASIPQGIFDLKQDAVVKILKGVTSFEEASSVIDFYEE